MIVAAIIWIVLIIGLTSLWMRDIGFLRALSAGLCRAGWTLPIILSLFPETLTRRIPGTVALQPIHILVDDSDSMKLSDPKGGSAKSQIKDLLKHMDQVCLQFGCLPKVTNLSEIASDTKKGFTPLSRVIEPWLYKTGGEPWILLTDGGDFRPSIAWDSRLKDRGSELQQKRAIAAGSDAQVKKTLGFIAAFGTPRVPGFSVESVAMAPIAFEGKSVQISTGIDRAERDGSGAQRVQVQVSVDGKVMTSGEAVFPAGASSASVDMVFPAPKRGPHIVSIKALPVAGELDTWDNTQTRVLEVMPNTVGVLHLLGSPAWDGRFMRRFLKAEPKFDIISFFILRDPWDSQMVSEREMSLIPFPVERLFKEELVNFRVIVMQNFTLMRFLQPEYQENLAKFVMDGGGLLFIGGPRALTDTDAMSSSLSGLLPFDMKPSSEPPPANRFGSGADFENPMGGMGSSWNPDTEFKIELAAPDASKRALANVFDSWQGLGTKLSSVSSMKGLHKMESINFHEKEVTPLLNAKLKDGKVVPLAVASYPGKGRALWLFSDSFWRLAMSSHPENARSDYHGFMDAALSWLTRGDMRNSLSVRDFAVSQMGDQGDRIKWRAVFTGSASRYIKTALSSKWMICGVAVSLDTISLGGASGDSLEVEGEVPATLRDGSLCSLKLDMTHPSFGSLSVTGWTVIPETLNDESMGPSPSKLRQLAKLTGATFVDRSEDRRRLIERWLENWGVSAGKSLPDKMKSSREFYWPQDYSWLWVLFLLLPCEILIRRWHLLAGQSNE